MPQTVKSFLWEVRKKMAQNSEGFFRSCFRLIAPTGNTRNSEKMPLIFENKDSNVSSSSSLQSKDYLTKDEEYSV